MAFTIYFSRFAKKTNSTARPVTSTAIAGVLRSGSSVMNPVFDIDAGGSLPNYNYAYVPEFGRYYYVTDWTLDGRLAVCSMSVDTLATYKDEIGAAELYILRSSEESDGSVMDAMYPAKNKIGISSVYGNGDNINLFPDAINSGRYIIGVVGKVTSDENPLGGITYMVLNEAAFSDFRAALFSDTLAYYKAGDTQKDAGLTSLGDSLAKMIFDPFQYVVSCCWMPYAPSTTGDVYTSWNVGFWTFETSNGIRILRPSTAVGRVMSFNIPKHPKAATRGSYLNTTPFSSYQLKLGGIGTYPLDSTKIVDESTISIYTRIDPVAQTSWVDVQIQKDDTNYSLAQIPADFCVPITLAKGGDLSIGQLSSFVGQSITSLAAAFGGGVPSIPNPLGMFEPNVQTVGGIGSLSTVTSLQPKVEACFYDVVDEDLDHHGRPLCKERRPSDLGGYMECLDGDLNLPGTAAENEEVKSYLQSGFFYE